MIDLTTGSPLKKIMLFSIPLLIGNFFQQMYSFSDTLIVGQTLGVKPLAAVGLTGALQFLVLGFANGLTVGLAIITAQKFGAKDLDGVKKSFAMGIIISLITSIFVTILALKFLPNILHLMRTPADIYQDAYLFIYIIFAGTFAQMAYNLLANVYRAVGDSRTPLIFLVVGQVLNVVLELWFILGFHMGVEGAGYATVISQIVSAVLLIVWIPKHLPVLAIKWADFKIVGSRVWEHVRVGYPVALQSSIIAIGSVILQMAINELGTDAVAATTAASKIDQFAVLVFLSFGTAMATYTAQNYGAHKFDRIIQGAKQITVVVILISFVIGALEIFFADHLVKLFIENGGTAEISAMAQTYFNVVGVTYALLAVLFIWRNVLQGTGNSIVPTASGVGELIARTFGGLFLVPVLGYFGAMLSNPLSWTASVLVMVIPYVRLMREMKTLQGMEDYHQAKTKIEA